MARAALPAPGSCSLELRQLLLLGGSCVSAFGAYPNAGPRPGVSPTPHICNSAEIHDCMRAFHPLPPIVRKRAEGPWSLPAGGSPRAWGQLRGPRASSSSPQLGPASLGCRRSRGLGLCAVLSVCARWQKAKPYVCARRAVTRHEPFMFQQFPL